MEKIGRSSPPSLTEPVQTAPDPAGGFTTNGLVELLALDDKGGFLALERSFSIGIGNSIRLYLAEAAGATDVSGTPSLASVDYTPDRT